MMAAVLSGEGALSRGDPKADRARAGRTGAPRNGRRGWWLKVERREAQRPSPMGARGFMCAARGGSVNPASKGASQALWRLPPLHRPRALCEGDVQTSDALRRENAEGWLFDIVDWKK